MSVPRGPAYKESIYLQTMSPELEFWEGDLPGYHDHGAVDGTAPPDLDEVLGRPVGRDERNIIRAMHAERNAAAKSLVRAIAPRLGISGAALDRVLELVDRARGCPQRARAAAALYAARAVPIGTLADALESAGIRVPDEHYLFRMAYRCGLSPGPMDPATAANIYSVNRLPETSRRLARYMILEDVDRAVRAAMFERAGPGASYRARAAAVLREVDRVFPFAVDWDEVDELW